MTGCPLSFARRARSRLDTRGKLLLDTVPRESARVSSSSRAWARQPASRAPEQDGPQDRACAWTVQCITTGRKCAYERIVEKAMGAIGLLSAGWRRRRRRGGGGVAPWAPPLLSRLATGRNRRAQAQARRSRAHVWWWQWLRQRAGGGGAGGACAEGGGSVAAASAASSQLRDCRSAGLQLHPVLDECGRSAAAGVAHLRGGLPPASDLLFHDGASRGLGCFRAPPPPCLGRVGRPPVVGGEWGGGRDEQLRVECGVA